MTDKPRRHQTATERDLAGIGAKKLRESGDWVTEHINDEITGQHEGDDLRELRARRPTRERVQRLEEKHDDLATIVTGMRVETSERLGDLTGAVKGLTTVVENSLRQNHVTFTARVDVDKAQAIDVIDEKKTRRELRAKVLGGVLGGGFIAQVLHQLGIL